MKKVISNKNNVSHGELLSTTQSIYNLWSRSTILLNEQVNGVSKLLIEGVTIVQTHIHTIRAELLTRSHSIIENIHSHLVWFTLTQFDPNIGLDNCKSYGYSFGSSMSLFHKRIYLFFLLSNAHETEFVLASQSQI